MGCFQCLDAAVVCGETLLGSKSGGGRA